MKRYPIAVGAGVIAATTLTLCLFRAATGPAAMPAPGRQDLPGLTPSPGPRQLPRTAEGTVPRRNPREAALGELMARWKTQMAAWKKNRVTNKEHYVLAEESVTSLLCGKEMLELLEFLDAGAGGAPFKQLVEQLIPGLFAPTPSRVVPFSPERAVAARGVLIESRDERYRQSPFFSHWLAMAAQGCPLQEIEAYIAAVGETRGETIIRMGRTVQMARAEPEAAIGRVFGELKEHADSHEVKSSLHAFTENLDPRGRWGELERLVPPGQLDSAADRLRSAILYSWGNADPAAAASYVLANSDRFAARHMNSAVAPYVQQNPEEATNWIQNIPHGPFFDGAVSAAVPGIMEAYPEQARELAGQVSDPWIRNQLMAWIAGAEDHRKRRK